jgi:hypothetical protein
MDQTTNSPEAKARHCNNWMPAVYAAYFGILREIAGRYGYALAIHGSLLRDFDLIAVPWIEQAGDPLPMLTEMCTTIGGQTSVTGLPYSSMGQKPHGRVAYTIPSGGGGYFDISVLSVGTGRTEQSGPTGTAPAISPNLPARKCGNCNWQKFRFCTNAARPGGKGMVSQDGICDEHVYRTEPRQRAEESPTQSREDQPADTSPSNPQSAIRNPKSKRVTQCSTEMAKRWSPNDPRRGKRQRVTCPECGGNFPMRPNGRPFAHDADGKPYARGKGNHDNPCPGCEKRGVPVEAVAK